MALIKCIECGKEISDRAASCPNCGCPLNNLKLQNDFEIPSNNPVNTNAQEKKIQEKSTTSEDVDGALDTSVTLAEEQQHTPKFYQKTWFVVLMLLMVFPVGVFMMWKYKKFNKIVRVITSLVLGIHFLFWTFIFIVLLIPCDHEWEPATCTKAKECWICGETEGGALGHDWQDATYAEPKTCVRCGDTEGECLERAQAYSSAGAVSAIKACFEFIPDCGLSISKETDSHGETIYALRNRGELVGIVGLDTDDFDVVALTDPDKENARLYHQQIAIALLLSSDSDMTYEEAKEYFEESEDEGLIWVNGYSSFISQGMSSGMYAFGIGY